MEPGAAPYRPPSPPRPASNPGRALGLLAISPCLLGLVVTGSKAAGPAGFGGAVLLAGIALVFLPRTKS